MADYYFAPAPAGDDANAGTFIDPWETVGKAITEAVGGDTCHFADGTYDVGAGVTLVRSGSDGSPITFRATNSRGAIWGTTSDGNPFSLDGFGWIDCEQLVFRGRVADAVGSKIVDARNSSNLNFTDCELEDTTGRGFWFSASANVTVVDCEIHPETNDATGQGVDGIQIDSGCSNIEITDTEIYHTNHDGIKVLDVAGITITGCYVHDNSSHNISTSDGAVTGALYHSNIIADAGSWRSVAGDKTGFRFEGSGIEDVVIRNNIVTGGDGPAFGIWTDVAGPLTFYNNTCYDNDKNVDYGEIYGTDVAGDNDPVITFKNNIFYHNTANRTYYWSAGTANVTIDYNLLYDGTGTEDIRWDGTTYATYAAYQTAGKEPNSVVSDNPDFTNPGADDFTLQVPASPALDVGVDLGIPFYGAAPDMGYWEYWGAPPPTEPSVATGVMVG